MTAEGKKNFLELLSKIMWSRCPGKEPGTRNPKILMLSIALSLCGLYSTGLYTPDYKLALINIFLIFSQF